MVGQLDQATELGQRTEQEPQGWQKILADLKLEIERLEQQEQESIERAGRSGRTESAKKTITDPQREKLEVFRLERDALEIVESAQRFTDDRIQLQIHIDDLSKYQGKLRAIEHKVGQSAEVQDTARNAISIIEHEKLKLAAQNKVLRDRLIKNPDLDAVDKIALITTGKTLEELKVSEKINAAENLWRVAQYIEDHRSEFSSDVQFKIQPLREGAEARLIQEGKQGGRALNNLREEHDPKKEYHWTRAQERKIKEYIGARGKEVSVVILLEEFVRQMSESGKIKPDADTTGGEHAKIQALEKQINREMRARLRSTEAQRQEVEALEDMYDVDLEFITGVVQKKFEQLGPTATLEKKLQEATNIVSLYNLPNLESPRKAYDLAQALDNASAELVCTVRVRILNYILQELIQEKDLTILASQKNTSFTADNLVQEQNKAHLKLLVRIPNGRRIYLDPSKINTQEQFDIIDESEKDIPIFDAAINEIMSPAGKNKLITVNRTSKETGQAELDKEEVIGQAYLLGAITDANNLAALNGDETLADFANSLHKNVQSCLLKASFALKAGNEREFRENIEQAKEISPSFRSAIGENNERLEDIKRVLTNTENLLTEVTSAAALTDRIKNGMQTGLPFKEWREITDLTIELFEYWGSNQGKYADDFYLGLAQVQSELLNALYDIRNYTDVTDQKIADGLNTYADARIRTSDFNIGISQSEFQRLQTLAENWKWEKKNDLYKNSIGEGGVPGLDYARNVVDNVEIWQIVQDRGLFNDSYSQLKILAENALTERNKFLVGNAKLEGYQIKHAAALAPLLSYIDMTYMRRMGVDGELPRGVQYYASQKGASFAKFFNCLYQKDPFMNQNMAAMVEAIGRPNVMAATRGANDDRCMLTKRSLYMAQINDVLLTNEALGARLRDAFDEEGYKKALGELEEQERNVATLRVIGPAHKGKVEGNVLTGHVYKNLQEWFIRQGYQSKDLKTLASVEAKLELEKKFLAIRAEAYDPTFNNGEGGYRNYWKGETLARIFLFGNASHLVDVYFSNSDELYEILEKTGEYAASKGVASDVSGVDLGKEINKNFYRLEQFVRGRNVEFEVASGEIGTDATKVAESIAKIKPADMRKVKDAYDQLQLAQAGGTPYAVAQANLEAAKTALQTARTSVPEFAPYQNAVKKIQELRELGITGGPEYEAAQSDFITKRTDYQAALTSLETAITARTAAFTAAKAVPIPALGGKSYNDIESAYNALGKTNKKAFDAYEKFVRVNKAMEKHRQDMMTYKTNFCNGGLNVGLEEHYNRQIANADAALNIFRSITDSTFPGYNPANITDINLINNAARLARNAVVDRLTWDQILTADNLLDLEQEGIDSTKTPAQRLADRNGRRVELQRQIDAMRFLYEAKVKLITGQSNWNRIKGYKGRDVYTGLRDFKFNKARGSYWEKILDPDAVINGRINEGHGGKAYIAFYGDDILRVANRNKQITKLAANKPVKSLISDMAAAQKDEEAIEGFLDHPFNDESIDKLAGNYKNYNNQEAEYERNELFLDGLVKARAMALPLRSIFSDQINRPIEALFPRLKPLLAKNSTLFYESNNTLFLRNFVDSKVQKHLISWEGARRIRKRRGLRGYQNLPVYGTSFLQWFILYLAIHPEHQLGSDTIKLA